MPLQADECVAGLDIALPDLMAKFEGGKGACLELSPIVLFTQTEHAGISLGLKAASKQLSMMTLVLRLHSNLFTAATATLDATSRTIQPANSPLNEVTSALATAVDYTASASALYSSMEGLVSSLATLKTVIDTLSEVFVLLIESMFGF